MAIAITATARVRTAAQTKPDLSGTWELDREASDDTESKILGGAGEDTTRGMPHLERARVLERLVELARAIHEIEIEQSQEDLKIFDQDDNVRIYYLDGETRARATPWGARLDVVARWDGPQISVRTTGREIGEVHETFGLEGRRLVYIVRIDNENFEDEILIRNYYDRQS
jgi:hypothetical protein